MLSYNKLMLPLLAPVQAGFSNENLELCNIIVFYVRIHYNLDLKLTSSKYIILS